MKNVYQYQPKYSLWVSNLDSDQAKTSSLIDLFSSHFGQEDCLVKKITSDHYSLDNNFSLV